MKRESKWNKIKTDKEEPDLAEDGRCHCMGVGLDGLQKSIPIQTILQ